MSFFDEARKINTNVMPINKDGSPCIDVSTILAYLIANLSIELTSNNVSPGYTIMYPLWINNYKTDTKDQFQKLIAEQIYIYYQEGSPEQFIDKINKFKETFISTVNDREILLEKQRKKILQERRLKEKKILLNQVIREMKVNKIDMQKNQSKFTIDFPPWLHSGDYDESLVKEIISIISNQSIKSLSEITHQSCLSCGVEVKSLET